MLYTVICETVGLAIGPMSEIPNDGRRASFEMLIRE